MLYTFDPKAMYSILVKDTELYPKKTAAYELSYQHVLRPANIRAEERSVATSLYLSGPVFSLLRARNIAGNASGLTLCSLSPNYAIFRTSSTASHTRYVPSHPNEGFFR